MKAFTYAAALTGLAYLAFRSIGAFVVFAVCAIVVGLASYEP